MGHEGIAAIVFGARAEVIANHIRARRAAIMAQIDALSTLVDVSAICAGTATDAAISPLALAAVRTIHVDATGVDVAVMRRGCWQGARQATLVHVGAKEAVSPVALRGAVAEVPERPDRSDEVCASGVL